MQNRWNDQDAARAVDTYGPRWGEAVALRTYTSRLLGRDPALVLHGGGNASVKAPWRTVTGDDAPAIFVKASGFDMATIEPAGHPALDLGQLLRLRRLERLDDEAMVNEVRRALFDARSPNPSIEALVHAFLPAAFIDHTHADAILVLTNQRDGLALLGDALGDSAAVLPYVEPGFQLAQAAAGASAAAPKARALVLMQHGLITWGASARESYERHIELVTKAEAFAAGRAKRGASVTVTDRCRVRGMGAPGGGRAHPARTAGAADGRRGSAVRARRAPADRDRRRARAAGPRRGTRRPGHAAAHHGPPDQDAQPARCGSTRQPGATRRPSARSSAARSRPTGRSYGAYVDRHRPEMPEGLGEFDPTPRVVLVPGLGAVCAGRTAREAAIARDITAQTLEVKGRIASMGTYEGLSERELFLMEYRGVQHAKLAAAVGPAGRPRGDCHRRGGRHRHRRRGGPARGGLPRRRDGPGRRVRSTRSPPSSTRRFPGRAVGVPMDVTDAASVAEAFRFAARTWGGVDLAIVNAGIAHVAALTVMDLDAFRKLERVNIEGTLLVLAECGRHFARQQTGGDIVLVSTKNVFAPGARFGAYSATKAAAHQLARIASLEMADLDVRVNMVSPDAVFSHGARRSGLWAEVGPDRMKARGLDEAGLEEYYRSRNLLKARVTARHVRQRGAVLRHAPVADNRRDHPGGRRAAGCDAAVSSLTEVRRQKPEAERRRPTGAA